MILREATHADIPALIALFLRLKRTTHYAGIAHDEELARATMRRCISGPQKYLKLIEHDGAVLAALLGTIEHQWWGPRYATDYGLFSQAPGGGAMLVRDFAAWAFAKPDVIEVVIGQSSGREIEATHELFVSLGFEHVGGIFRLGRYDHQEMAA